MRRRLLTLFFVSVIFVPLVTVISLALVNLESSPGVESSSATTKFFVDPPWVWDETLEAGSTFTVNVNVSGVDDLFAWQVSMSWNSSVLNATITFGDFLAGTSSPNGTYPVSKVDNATGYALFGETTLGDYPGVSGNVCLATVEFLVVGYGATHIDISNLTRTVLLNSTLGDMEFTIGVGYFSNKVPGEIPGDVDGDGDVDSTDFLLLLAVYGTKAGQLSYKPEADLDHDGDVDSTDFLLLLGNYGQSV